MIRAILRRTTRSSFSTRQLPNAVLLLAATGHYAWAQGNSSAKSLDQELRDLQKVLRIPGMSAAVVLKGRIVWARGYGFADIENRRAATTKTEYPIASLTKTFSATLAMQLAQKGLLSLDAPIRKYLSDFENDSVTVRHILSHRSEDLHHRRGSNSAGICNVQTRPGLHEPTMAEEI